MKIKNLLFVFVYIISFSVFMVLFYNLMPILTDIIIFIAEKINVFQIRFAIQIFLKLFFFFGGICLFYNIGKSINEKIKDVVK